MVVVDRVQLEMVLHNLLGNAIDALAESPGEERKITVTARPQDSATVAIAVQDTGPGVASNIAPQLFQTFVSSRNAGMGLGLAISRSIVERHGGRLSLDESVNGATFTVTLPAVTGDTGNAG